MNTNDSLRTESYILRDGHCGEILKHYVRSSPYWPTRPRPDHHALFLDADRVFRRRRCGVLRCAGEMHAVR